jgi:hypothetical protein
VFKNRCLSRSFGSRYLPFHDVHEPYEAEDRFLDERIEDNGRQTMAAMVSCVSEGTGNVSRALREAGMWETTLFIWCVRREHLVDATLPLPRCSRLRCRWLAMVAAIRSADNGGPQYWLGNNYPLRYALLATNLVSQSESTKQSARPEFTH